MNIRHDMAGKRFVATVDGGDAHILYRRVQINLMISLATYVPTESRGKKVADQLVREAIRVAKADNVKIIDSCPYVHGWFQKHPEENKILSKDSGDLSFKFFNKQFLMYLDS